MDQEKYTFENFISADYNEVALNRAKAVARAFDGDGFDMLICPVIIYGGPLSGKTHLLKAVENYVSSKHPEKKILYTNGRDIAREIEDYDDAASLGDFNRKFENLDLLIIDDLQQMDVDDLFTNELAKIFNKLYERDVPMIFASDRPIGFLDFEGDLSYFLEYGISIDIGSFHLDWANKLNFNERKITECILKYGDKVHIGDSFCGISSLDVENTNSIELELTDVEVINIKDKFMLLQILGDASLILAEGKSSKYHGHLYVEKIILACEFTGSDPQNELETLSKARQTEASSKETKCEDVDDIVRKIKVIQELLIGSIYDGDADPLYSDAAVYVNTLNTISATSLQRKFRIGYNRASKLINRLERNGMISPADGTHPRKVLTREDMT